MEGLKVAVLIILLIFPFYSEAQWVRPRYKMKNYTHLVITEPFEGTLREVHREKWNSALTDEENVYRSEEIVLHATGSTNGFRFYSEAYGACTAVVDEHGFRECTTEKGYVVVMYGSRD